MDLHPGVLVNAAIERLLLKEDESGEAARIVIEYGHKLPTASIFKFELLLRGTSKSTKIKGQTPGQGQVEIKDEHKEESKEYTLGFKKSRIGHYRLWKERRGLLRFHHFWKSSLTTQSLSDEPEEYHLKYDEKNLEPVYFAVLRERVVLNLFLFKITEEYLELIYGTLKSTHFAWVLTS